MNDELKGAIETWIRHDPDPGTQAELTMLYDADDVDELTERFSGRLEFGTAGLRGKLGGGPNRMNRAVVITTTDGLARYLLSKPVDAATRGVVIGYDGRRMSAEFAEETARVLGGHGIPVHWFGRRVSTPLTAFAVTDLECAAGVMITASHNPPDYNGYKLYWNNGAQIIPPHDGGIEASIENAPPANRVTRPDLEALALRGLLRRLDRAVDQRYIAAVLANRVHPLPEPLAELPVVYTAMHGVGYELFSHLAKAAGFGTFHVVREQIEPDGEFPTVRLPNPEETSALEMAIELSNRVGAELILANDPDADRLAVCLRKEDGTFHHFSGDEIGILLADYLIREHQATGTLPENALVETTIVSSGLLGKMAKKHGLVYSETLTGFKWIANRALELEAGQKATFLFGYEEAIGYTIGRTVRDKDGISTALLTLEMWWTLKRRNQTLLERLEAIYREYDLHQKRQTSFVLEGLEGQELILAAMQRLRESPPDELAGIDVVSVFDYQARTRRSLADGNVTPLDLPASNVIAFELADGSRVTARPSGTEPKLKLYYEATLSDGSWLTLSEGQHLANGKIDRFAASLVACAGLAT